MNYTSNIINICCSIFRPSKKLPDIPLYSGKRLEIFSRPLDGKPTDMKGRCAVITSLLKTSYCDVQINFFNIPPKNFKYINFHEK